MPLIFIGGARGTGKTPILSKIKACDPHIEYIQLSKEVRRMMSFRAFHKTTGIGMRQLTPEQQCEAISVVIRNLLHQTSSKFVFVEGHYVSTSYVDHHKCFFPCLNHNAVLFARMFLVKTEPGEIMLRRLLRKKRLRSFDLTRREYLAEGLEARYLERTYGTLLVKCTNTELVHYLQNELSVLKRIGEYITVEQRRLPLSSVDVYV